jgi:hypothetical protein
MSNTNPVPAANVARFILTLSPSADAAPYRAHAARYYPGITVKVERVRNSGAEPRVQVIERGVELSAASSRIVTAALILGNAA